MNPTSLWQPSLIKFTPQLVCQIGKPIVERLKFRKKANFARFCFVLLSQKGKIGKEHIMQSEYMALHGNHNFTRARHIKDIKEENT